MLQTIILHIVANHNGNCWERHTTRIVFSLQKIDRLTAYVDACYLIVIVLSSSLLISDKFLAVLCVCFFLLV